ncbi:Bug family tripartite tricarboxylate transporter substrate binding protein, partial [Klebsiella pneumoniae]|uniref:Bug family tripartite tricarboxylate transporter substrate binding protein n=1 Tax=Klebsiella pneumoniae TaxID=573 RepID=UPI003854B82D
GANGTIAANYVARAPADGHTLFLSTNTPHAAAATLMKSIAYDPIKDFAPISKVGNYTFVLAVHPSVKAMSVKELI